MNVPNHTILYQIALLQTAHHIPHIRYLADFARTMRILFADYVLLETDRIHMIFARVSY